MAIEFIDKLSGIDGTEAKKHDAHTIGIRPEHINVSSSEGSWKGVVGVAEHLGSDTFLHIHDSGLADPMTVRVSGEVDFRYGDTIYMTPHEDKIQKFDAEGLRIT